MDIVKKINELRNDRKWSVNNLAMEAGLTQSTLSSMLSRNSPPRLDTLQAICGAFGITLAQFFLEDESIEMLSEIEMEMLDSYAQLMELRKTEALGVFY